MREVLGEVPNIPGVDAMPTPVKARTRYDCGSGSQLDLNVDAENARPNSSPDYHTTTSFPRSPPYDGSPTQDCLSPPNQSPLKYRFQDHAIGMVSPPESPAQSTEPFHEDLPGASSDVPYHSMMRKSSIHNTTSLNEDMSTIHEHGHAAQIHRDRDRDAVGRGMAVEFDHTTPDGDTIADLSTISAIPAEMTRFANHRSSPSKVDAQDGWTPRANRNSIAISTPATGQRPLHLLSRRSTGSNEDVDATPRGLPQSTDSPTDLLNFTAQSNIVIPPPGPTPRNFRRSPSGRGAFPIRINPTPSHRSQASVERERASGRSPQKPLPDQQQPVPATPASARNSTHSATSFGMDLLDIDLAPMATPRSIPTVTPRELENLRSELQSRISGLEATLAGKEAEVTALKKSITDAEIRAGKSGEELLIERAEKEELMVQKNDLGRRAREMEDVLREVKQNAFVEEREREKLRKLAEEAERKTEECEVKILELNASLETLRSERVRNSPSPVKGGGEPSTPGMGSPVDVDAAVKNATETVARELHALYKSKHERKVADLKLSYEKRWAKQVDALKADLKAAQDENSRLLTDRDANLTGLVVPGQAEAVSKMEGQIEELRRWNEDLSAQKKVVEAELAGVKSELDAVRRENDTIRADLEAERIEKGELVAQVEVFLTVSAEQEQQREAERDAREARERERQPASPPRSDASGDSTSTAGSNHVAPVSSPHKSRPSNGAVPVSGRPRPMSMLVKPSASKFGSGIPGPGASGLKQPTAGTRPAGMYQRSSLMDGITRMGAGSR